MNERVPIGVGTEKRIFQSEQDPKLVEGVYRKPMTNEEIKGVYYYNKLLNILFPNNTMSIHRAGNSKPPAVPTSSFLADKADLDAQALEFAALGVDAEALLPDEVPNEELKERLREGGEKGSDMMNDERIYDLHKKFASVGVPLDWNHRNYSFDEHGEAIFLDVQKPFRDLKFGVQRLNFDPTKLKEAIESLDVEEKHLATVCFERLMELHQELDVKNQTRIIENLSSN